ncbi:CRISPR-associated protein Csd1 [Bifidobacterium commune]|uniref:CRISPR-associated protein Csd1 n=1 Tax=Bifidobacterium commune TaxID=1505727 RepID=A0A1C4H3Y4_9BIFI|nr:type I-C CRISPR-associated protein Cas8c/Csd1 [Bifidobacterium commune]MBB2955128.1 CRISPR-associated protein Csd1 [Bifidobacterium commune]SCC79659.1 CRISPR-associated protein Csd1 [Bifidobacterium commune]
MSLWSTLLGTYGTIEAASGEVVENEDSSLNTKKMLSPLFHIPLKTRLHVIIDSRGDLIGMEMDSKDVSVMIPCTEQSMGRSGKDPVPHPLCDQIAYLDSKFDTKKHMQYVELLDSWKGQDPKLNAIYTYVTTHSVIDDAAEKGLLQSNENEADGDEGKHEVIVQVDPKIGVRFSVHTLTDEPDEVWMDWNLQKRWIDHLIQGKTPCGSDSLGEPFFQSASNFPKNIVGAAGNAKLISSNDKSNFTYRGRFQSAQEAIRIDSNTSQKVHAALKWLIGNNGRTVDKQTVVVWAVEDNPTRVVQPSANTYDILHQYDVLDKSDQPNHVEEAKTAVDTNYAKQFHRIVRGFAAGRKLSEHSKTVVVAIFDAATTGRLSVTYYVELAQDEYLESVASWHEEASWPLTYFEKKEQQGANEKIKTTVIPYIGAPSFLDITNCAYGPGEHTGAGYTSFRKNTEKQLIEAMFSNGVLPRPLAVSAFYHVLRPESYASLAAWRHDFEVACSIWKKTLNQHKPEKEQIPMALDTKRKDRDYLYGRLLAFADELESEILYKRGIDRPTSAVKLLTNFAARPYSTWNNICSQLAPYLQSVKSAQRFAYENSIDEVTDMFEDRQFEDNSALSPLFLLGYSSQRRALRNRFTKNNDSAVNSNEQGE